MQTQTKSPTSPTAAPPLRLTAPARTLLTWLATHGPATRAQMSQALHKTRNENYLLNKLAAAGLVRKAGDVRCEASYVDGRGPGWLETWAVTEEGRAVVEGRRNG